MTPGRLAAIVAEMRSEDVCSCTIAEMSEAILLLAQQRDAFAALCPEAVASALSGQTWGSFAWAWQREITQAGGDDAGKALRAVHSAVAEAVCRASTRTPEQAVAANVYDPDRGAHIKPGETP